MNTTTKPRYTDLLVGILIILLPIQGYIPHKVPLLGWHISLAYIGTLLLFTYVILKERKIPKSRLFLSLTIFTLTMLTSLPVAISKRLAIQYIILWLLFCMAYIITLYETHSEEQILRILGILSICISGLAIYQYLIGPERVMEMVQGWFGRYLMHPGTVQERLQTHEYSWVWLGNVKVFGNFININTFAAFLNLLYPIALAQALSDQRHKTLYWSLISLLLSVSIWFTISRGGILTMFASTAIIIIYYRKNASRAALLCLAFIVSIILLSIISGALYPQEGQNTIIMPSIQRLLTSFSTSKNQDRLELWNLSIEITKNNPFLGVGIANYGLYAQEHYEGIYTIAPAHNNFLQILAEQGLIGLLAYLWLLFEAMRILILTLKVKPTKGLAIGLLGSLISVILMGLINVTYLDVQYGLFFLALLGIIDALYNEPKSIQVPIREVIS